MNDFASTNADADQLINKIRSYGRAVVAFSGGVDSSVVAAAAYRADPDNAVAVTADSPSVPRWQLKTARTVAREIGIRHQLVATSEVLRRDYQRNDLRRCYYCKETLYATLEQLAQASGGEILSGTNADDLGDYRPGIQAGDRAGVHTPLAELSLSKQRVRALAKHFGLSNADLPASPCLASRIAYGVEVTPERLGRVETAEAFFRKQGFSDVRVRVHADELARIEVPPAELGRLVSGDALADCDKTLRAIGFRYVTIDVGGLRSGSMNPEVVSIDTMRPSDPGKPEALH